MPNLWFRMYGEFRHDPKIRTMSDSLQIRLVRLFCLRSDGKTEFLGKDELCFGLGCSPEELEVTKSVFLEKGFVDESWTVLNWDKRQFCGQKSSLPTGGSRSRGYVYYVADRSNFVVGSSLMKIGFSSNPWARVKELRTAIPNLEILGVESGDFGMEVSIHQKFKHLRKEGEWFIADQELLDYVAKLRSSSVAIATMATNRTDTEQKEHTYANGSANSLAIGSANGTAKTPAQKARVSEGQKKEKTTTSRYAEFIDLSKRYWDALHESGGFTFGARDGKMAKEFLARFQTQPIDEFESWFNNMIESDNVNTAWLPCEFIPQLHKYADSPLDTFGRPKHD